MRTEIESKTIYAKINKTHERMNDEQNIKTDGCYDSDGRIYKLSRGEKEIIPEDRDALCLRRWRDEYEAGCLAAW